MITQEQISTIVGRNVYDRGGDKIGSVGQVWADAAGMPTWASVNTGLFGMKETMIPLQTADLQSDRLVVPFEKSHVKDAPNVDASHNEPLSEAEVDRLYRHYGLSWDDSYNAYQAGAAASNASYTGTTGYDTGYDTSGATTDNAMTRSEERLKVGTQTEQVGRARLRKYVVTEQQQISVPVSHEEVRLEREPITDANAAAAYSGAEITESEHEVTLRAERAVVHTEAVPVERVRLGKETVTEHETVTGTVRKEQIEADIPGEGRRPLS
jgi:uncharacterized protein (TIGR02271 family)